MEKHTLRTATGDESLHARMGMDIEEAEQDLAQAKRDLAQAQAELSSAEAEFATFTQRHPQVLSDRELLATFARVRATVDEIAKFAVTLEQAYERMKAARRATGEDVSVEH